MLKTLKGLFLISIYIVSATLGFFLVTPIAAATLAIFKGPVVAVRAIFYQPIMSVLLAVLAYKLGSGAISISEHDRQRFMLQKAFNRKIGI